MSKQALNLEETVVENRLISFWRLLAGHRLLYLTAVIALGLAALAQTGIFYLLRYFVDTVLPSETLAAQLPWVAVGFVALALVQGGFTFTSGRLAAYAAEQIALQVRNYLYDHIQRLSFTYHDNQQTGELLQRATSDVEALRKLFAEQGVGIGRIVLMFVVNFVAIVAINGRLALYSIVIIPIVLIIAVYFFKKVGEVFDAFQEQEAVLSNRLQEHLTGIRVVKAFARQAYELERFEADNYEKFRRGRRLSRMHAIFWPSTDVITGLQMIAGFYIGAQMAIEGTITVGAFLAYAGFLGQIIWPIRNLGRLIADISTGDVAFTRIKHIMRETREPLAEQGTVVPGPNGLRGELVFHHVDFAYDADTPVLHDIDFAVRPGQVVALLGGTGSGKTSLVGLLPRFYDYTSGSITLDGIELREYRRQELRQQIGIVMQEPFLFSGTVRDNIAYGAGRAVTEEEIVAAAKAAAVHDVVMSFPKGYDTIVGERGVTLSGGQKQRVTLARTLLINPRILILDDATSSVDTETEAEIRSALLTLMQDRTTFVIAHRIQTVMTADLILVLENGRIVQRGTHDELVDEPGIYQQIYDLQARIEEELEEDLATVNGYQNGYAMVGSR
ncbi:MAG: ABC transporter ATP-binding protein [Chloroflexota bacterium]